jgi:hypothetical protein
LDIHSADSGSVSPVQKANKKKTGNKPSEIDYHGKTFPVPHNAAELKITHAVMGEHSLRGPLCVRWMREHPDPDRRRKEILDEIFNLYGSAVTGIKFIEI